MSEKTTRTKTKKPVAAKAPAKTAAKKAVAKPKAAPKAPKAPKKELTPREIAKMAALAAGQLAIEKKATNVKLLDVGEITSMTDYFIIASASSDIQVKAIADHILTEMREKHGVAPWKSEGWDTRKWIIVEGILVLAIPEIRETLDLMIYVDTDADVRLARRIRRDMAERGRSLENILEQWEASVRPMHQEFVEPSRRYAHLILPQTGVDGPVLPLLIDHLRARSEP